MAPITTIDFPANDPLTQPDKKAVIDGILQKNRHLPGATMVVLNQMQTEIGYITEPMQQYAAKKLGVPVSSIHGVVTFYSFFTTHPRGRHTVKFCMGTACYVGGTPQLIEKAKQMLKTELGATTSDGAVTLDVCRCVGACSQAPVVVVDEEAMGRVRANKLPQILKKLQD